MAVGQLAKSSLMSDCLCMNELSRVPFLLVEDNERDIELMRRAFTQLRLTNPLQVVRDGEEAIDYLAGKDGYATRPEFPLPFLILLDLYLPKRDGFEVLRWLRRARGLDHILVVVLSASEEDEDIRKAYALGADSYLIKPGAVAHLKEMMELLQKHWPVLNNIVEFRQQSSKAA
jgi:CheY-like chemotaxis protein